MVLRVLRQILNPADAQGRRLGLRERLLLRLEGLVGHRQNASGNNQSQR